MTREVVDQISENPLANYSPRRELNNIPKIGRMRNARGQY